MRSARSRRPAPARPRGNSRRSAGSGRPTSRKPICSRKATPAAARPPSGADRHRDEQQGFRSKAVSHDWLPFVAAVPVILGLLVVGARAFLSVSQGPVAARLQSAVPAYETALDWAVHFSVGTMVL